MTEKLVRPVEPGDAGAEEPFHAVYQLGPGHVELIRDCLFAVPPAIEAARLSRC
jgi:hypothetical protein